MKRSFYSLVLIAAFSVIAPLAEAQITGSIRGTVADAQGAVLPGVTVTDLQ